MSPTPQQQAALESASPLTFVVAGAGAGKTKTLVWRIQHLVEQLDVDPLKIVALTFTNGAAKVMKQRLEAIHITLGFVGTLHSFVLRLLRDHAPLVGYKPSINILDEEESELFRNKVASDHKWDGTDKELDAAIAMGPPLATERLTKSRLVAAAYYKALKGANLMTFDAILIYGLMVCRAIKIEAMGGLPYTHYLIDEVQDSSPLDFKIYGSLVGDRYFSGDPDQAIFSFRKGDVSLCLSLANTAKVLLLEDNFRCGSNICDAAQRLILHNRSRYPKTTRSATGFEGDIAVVSYSDPSVEAAGIANHIASCSIDRSDIAVLVRTNDLVTEYANHLRAVGIPISERVYKPRPEDFWKAKVLLAFLNNPDDDYVADKWLRVVTTEHAVERARALNTFRTINQQSFKMKRATSFMEIQTLGTQFISSASMELIAKVNATLPSFDIADLILAIGKESDAEEVGEGVVVTTIHGAKGREFSLVFLPAFENTICPLISKRVDLEEERRLAFVAITRAKHSLVISHAAVRVTSEDRARMKRSPSFRAIPVATTPSQFIAEAGL